MKGYLPLKALAENLKFCPQRFFPKQPFFFFSLFSFLDLNTKLGNQLFIKFIYE